MYFASKIKMFNKLQLVGLFSVASGIIFSDRNSRTSTTKIVIIIIVFYGVYRAAWC